MLPRAMSPSSSDAAAITAVTRGDLSLLRLSGAQSTLEVSPQGAHLTDWTIPGMPPILFLSPKAVFLRGKAIRGGVPLVFPWFGPNAGDPRAAQHGFARMREWRLQAASAEGGACDVAMTLS